MVGKNAKNKGEWYPTNTSFFLNDPPLHLKKMKDRINLSFFSITTFFFSLKIPFFCKKKRIPQINSSEIARENLGLIPVESF
jgi:hypothetical protein